MVKSSIKLQIFCYMMKQAWHDIREDMHRTTEQAGSEA